VRTFSTRREHNSSILDIRVQRITWPNIEPAPKRSRKNNLSLGRYFGLHGKTILLQMQVFDNISLSKLVFIGFDLLQEVSAPPPSAAEGSGMTEPTAVGIGQPPVSGTTPSLLNSAYNPVQFWPRGRGLQSEQRPQELPFRFAAIGGKSLAGFLSKNPFGFRRKPM